MRKLMRALTRAARCEHLGHEWQRVGFRTYACTWCGEPGFRASDRDIAALGERWGRRRR